MSQILSQFNFNNSVNEDEKKLDESIEIYQFCFNNYLNFLLGDNKNINNEIEIIYHYLMAMDENTLNFHKTLFINNNEIEHFPNINTSIKTFMSFNFLDELFFKFYIYHINLKINSFNDNEFIKEFSLEGIKQITNPNIQYFLNYKEERYKLEDIAKLLIEKFNIYKNIIQADKQLAEINDEEYAKEDAKEDAEEDAEEYAKEDAEEDVENYEYNKFFM